MLSLIMFHVIMNIKKNDTLSPCNSAGRKFEILKRCVPKMWLHMIRLDQLSPYGMTYQRGSKSKLFSIRTRLSLGQRALCRLDLRLTCLYSLASFIECSLAWLFQQNRTVHLLCPLGKIKTMAKSLEIEKILSECLS